MPAVLSAARPPFSWTSLEGRTIVREIIEARLPQWQNGPKATQVRCWSYTLEKIPTILVASTGWGKTSAFYGPLSVQQNLRQYPRPNVPQPPKKLVALVVTPLIELGNAHVSPYSLPSLLKLTQYSSCASGTRSL